MQPTINNMLIIDDEKDFCRSLTDYFQSDDVRVESAHSLKAGRAILAKRLFNIIVLDQILPDGLGIDLCREILTLNEHAKIILITAYPRCEAAVEAIKTGAYDYLSKPIDLKELEHRIKLALHAYELENIARLQTYQEEKNRKANVLIGANQGLSRLARHLQAAIDSDSNVLLTGESGTGKNVVARYIHYAGNSAPSPFISINCAAIAPSLIEAELFGAEKGAYTGSVQAHRGIFEMAHKGTVFLDEIGAMPYALQSKLLGVLEDKQIKRIGAETYRNIHARIIAATNIDIHDAINQGRFRKDLFYRLNIIHIHLPPLRDRKEDIQKLCAHFISMHAKGAAYSISPYEIEQLTRYDWPGNIRELKNIIERSILLHNNHALHPSTFINVHPHSETVLHSDPSMTPEPSLDHPDDADITPLPEVEKRHILKSIKRFNFNYAKTARTLEISESTLRRKLREYNQSDKHSRASKTILPGST